MERLRSIFLQPSASSSPARHVGPYPRSGHTLLFGYGNLYLWGGLQIGQNDQPRVHDSQAKREFLSFVDVFQPDCGDWIRQKTNGTPPLGVSGYSCAAVGDSLYYYGGYCGHDECYHNSVHELSLSSLQWMTLSPTTSESGTPMRKMGSGMVAFRDGEDDFLYVAAGWGMPVPLDVQPEALYERSAGSFVVCNEQHMFSLSTREWISPDVTGQCPPPCHDFTLTPVGERKAALFGGINGPCSDDLLLVELKNRHSVQWTIVSKPVNLSLWPEGRCSHAAACVSGSLLVIMGGRGNKCSVLSDCWIYDFTAMRWTKLQILESVTERMCHSLSALMLSPYSVLLVVFGGQRSLQFITYDVLLNTFLIELIKGEDDQWMVGRVGTALEIDKTEYQQMVSEWRLRQLQLQLQHERERARAVEQRLTNELQQLTIEREQEVQQAQEREQQLMREIQQLNSEMERITQENERLMKENQLQEAQIQLQSQLLHQDQERPREREDHLIPPTHSRVTIFSQDDTPTLLKLKRMKGPDGLGAIDTIAAGDYETFGMELLNDENGQKIDLITKDLSGVKATESILKQWLTGTIPDTNPYPRTYCHLVECLKEAEMGALAEHIQRKYN